MIMVGFCQLAQYCVIGTVIDIKVRAAFSF